jgi:hypothetical protein
MGLHYNTILGIIINNTGESEHRSLGGSTVWKSTIQGQNGPAAVQAVDRRNRTSVKQLGVHQ